MNAAIDRALVNSVPESVIGLNTIHHEPNSAIRLAHRTLEPPLEKNMEGSTKFSFLETIIGFRPVVV